jgi:exopolyphosphatase/guanosine-5'-triphosphate,3'-diphosphate pyrophosphatase
VPRARNRYGDDVRLGVLDIGSNTVHLLIVDAHAGAAPLPAWKSKIALRLAEHLEPDGSIDVDAAGRLVDFIREAQLTAEDLGAAEFLAFATSAIREAPNGAAVLADVLERTGVEVEVLSGADEARLTFLAVRRWFGWSAGRLLVLDIGGGSLELAAGDDEEPEVAVSVPLGAGRLTRDFLAGDPPTADDVREVRRVARAALGSVVGKLLRSGEPRIAVATSKTFRQLARIAGAAPSSEGFHVRRVLSSDDLRTWVPKLAEMTAAERARLPGVSESRAPQLLAGAIVAEAALDLLGIEEVEIGPWALREGVILRRLDSMES